MKKAKLAQQDILFSSRNKPETKPKNDENKEQKALLYYCQPLRIFLILARDRV